MKRFNLLRVAVPLALASLTLSAQTVAWTKQFRDAGSPYVSGVATDGTGAYVVGTGDAPLNGASTSGGFIRKFDSAGSIVWTKQFEFVGLHGTAADGTNIYVAGLTNADAWLGSYNAATGATNWTITFGKADWDEAFQVAVDSTGVYVMGQTKNDLDGTNAGQNDIFLRKYSRDGQTLLWSTQVGTGGDEYPGGVAVNGSSVYLEYNIYGNGAVLRKYDASTGVEGWSRSLWAETWGIRADASGVYVSGLTNQQLEGTGAYAGGQLDGFVRKYDTSGSELWTRQIGTSGFEIAREVAVDASGVYVTGLTYALIDPLASDTPGGNQDGFVRKYALDGTFIWGQVFGTIANDDAYYIAAGASGVYVSSNTGGSFDGTTNGGVYLRRYGATVQTLDEVITEFKTAVSGLNATRGVKQTLTQHANLAVVQVKDAQRCQALRVLNTQITQFLKNGLLSQVDATALSTLVNKAAGLITRCSI